MTPCLSSMHLVPTPPSSQTSHSVPPDAVRCARATAPGARVSREHFCDTGGHASSTCASSCTRNAPSIVSSLRSTVGTARGTPQPPSNIESALTTQWIHCKYTYQGEMLTFFGIEPHDSHASPPITSLTRPHHYY